MEIWKTVPGFDGYEVSMDQEWGFKGFFETREQKAV